MQSLTSGLGNSSNVNKGTIEPQQVKRVLISRPNHRLGNLLLITPLPVIEPFFKPLKAVASSL